MKRLINFIFSHARALIALLIVIYLMIHERNVLYFGKQFSRLNTNLENIALETLASQRRVDISTREWRKEAQDNLAVARYCLNLADSLNNRIEKHKAKRGK